MIITIRHDTIFCKIKSVSSTHIQYEQKTGYRTIVGRFIPKEQVLEYYMNIQSSKTNRNLRTSKPSNRWIIGLYPGRSSLLASDDIESMTDLGIPKSQADEYSRRIRHGWNINGDIHFLITDFFGLGAKYSMFTSSAQQNFTIKINNYYPEFLYMGMKENLYIHYAGPSFLFRQWLNDKRNLQLTESLSAGYVHYRDEIRQTQALINTLIPNCLAEGNTWGASAGLSFDYYPQSWLSIGVKAEFMYACLTKINLSTKELKQTIELEKKDYEYLTRLDYSLAVRFHF